MNDERSRGLEALSDALLSVTAERSSSRSSRSSSTPRAKLAGARYAALGVPDGEGGFAQFITSGMSEKLIAAMGPLPRTHGLLGLMLESEEPYRALTSTRIRAFRAGGRAPTPTWSFLGVPIVARTGVIGAFYLTEKEGRPEFDDGDERLIVLLAAHAAITIENARSTSAAASSASSRSATGWPRAARFGQPEAVRARPLGRVGDDPLRR